MGRGSRRDEGGREEGQEREFDTAVGHKIVDTMRVGGKKVKKESPRGIKELNKTAERGTSI